MQQERCARREAWELAISVYKLKKHKATFCSPIEARVMPAPTSKSPDERECVDSGALRKSTIRTTVVTADGDVQTNEEAQVYVWHLDLFATMQLLEDTPAVLSLGESSAKSTVIPMSGPAVKSHIWPKKKRGSYAKRKMSYLLLSLDCRQVLAPARLQHRFRRTHQEHLQVQQQSEVTIGHQETGAIQKKEGQRWGSGKPSARPPRVVRRVHTKSRRYRCACTRTPFSWLRFGTSYKSGTREAMCLYSLPERPKLRCVLANQDDKGSLQKTHWRSSTSSRKVWWHDNSRSRSSQWRRWIPKQSPTRSRGTRSRHSMDTVLFVQNENFSGDESHVYTDNSLELGKSCEDLSRNHRTSAPHRSETKGTVQRAVRRIKEGTSAFLLQSRLDEKWWADSMKCYCNLRSIQDLLADGKTPYERRFGEPFRGPMIPFGSMVEYHLLSAKDQRRLHHFGEKVLPGIFLG